MIIEQLSSTLIIILIVAAILSLILEDSYFDAIIIFSIVVINAWVGVLQEYKTEQTLEHLKNFITSYAYVMRDGKMQKIISQQIVPGDIIIIN